MSSLQKEAISGVRWTTLKTGFIAGTGPVLQIVKARFLIPEEFAYIAIIMIFIGLFRTLENFGISQAIIQRDSIDEQETSSLLFFNVLLAFLFGLILYFLSPFIADFFSLPGLDYYLKLTCIIIIAASPAHLFRAFLEKNLLFRELSIVEMTTKGLTLGLIIFLLYMGYGVLGVIYGNIASTILSTVIISFMCFKNKLVKLSPSFKLKKIMPFLRFGVYVSGKQTMTFIAHRMDEVIIGYFLAPEVLGIYHFGKHMLEKLRELITASFSKVLYPVFSKIKHDANKLSLAYKRISRYISFISFPIFTGIAVTAHLFVPILFGEEWVESVIVFQVFSLALILMILTANVSSSLLYSLNKPGLVFYIDVLTNIIYFLSLYLLVYKGITGILFAYSLYVIYKILALQYYANRQLIHSFFDYLRELKPAGILTLAMVIGIIIFQIATQKHFDVLLQFIGSVTLGGLLYFALGLLFYKNAFEELKEALLKGTVTRS